MSNFILQYKEQCCLCDEVSAEAYTEEQKVQFLNMKVAGTLSLSNVLKIHNAAKRAAGVTTSISWGGCQAKGYTGCHVHEANGR